MSDTRIPLTQARRCVVKIGSALLTQDGLGLDTSAIGGWVAQMAELRQRGVELLMRRQRHG